MSEEMNGDLSLGLSSEEKEDLEKLIVACRGDSAGQLKDEERKIVVVSIFAGAGFIMIVENEHFVLLVSA